MANIGHKTVSFDVGGQVFRVARSVIESAGLFVKKTVPGHDTNIPKSVSRVLQLYSILAHFPQTAAAWERHNMYGALNLMASIVFYMTENDILPNPDIVNWSEHCNIVTSGKQKYFSHDVYREYKATVPANLHQNVEYLHLIWKTIPLHLKFLISAGNKGKRY